MPEFRRTYRYVNRQLKDTTLNLKDTVGVLCFIHGSLWAADSSSDLSGLHSATQIMLTCAQCNSNDVIHSKVRVMEDAGANVSKNIPA